MPVLKIKNNDKWETILGGAGGGSVEVDTSLTQEGMAADAKAVGEALDALDTIIAVDEADDGNIELTSFLGGFGDNIDADTLGGIPAEQYAKKDEIISLPSYDVDDNNKILSVIDGVPTWISLKYASEVEF